MKIPSLDLLANAFLTAFRRFPMVMLAVFVGVFFLINLIEKPGFDEYVLAKIWWMSQLAIPVFVGLKVYGEAKNWQNRQHWLANAVVVAMLVGYFFWLDPAHPHFENIELPRLLAWFAVAHLWVSFAPFLGRTRVEDFLEYNKQLFAHIVVGALYSLVLWGGLSAAIFATDALFEIKIDPKTYAELLVVIAGIFNTSFFLFHFPADFHFDDAEIEHSAVFRDLCKFILIPIATLYFIILYVYSGKILATWNLPHGWVASLVIGFAAAGIFTWLLNFLLPRTDGGSIVTQFKKWFWPVLFPMVALLFVAIARRIWDYGITEPRFLVAHTGAWLTLCCVFFVFIKSEDLKFIPISMAAFILTGIYGPFSAFESTKRSQMHQLKTLLERNGLLISEKAKPSEKPLKNEDTGRIHEGLRILEERGALGKIQPWFERSFAEMPAKNDASDESSRIEAYLNIEPGNFDLDEGQFSVWANVQSSSAVAGYAEFFVLNAYLSQDQQSTGRYFNLENDGAELTLRDSNMVLDRFSTAGLTERCVKQRAGQSSLELKENEAIVNLSGSQYDALLVLTNAGFEKSGDHFRPTNLNGFLFLKSKK